MIDEFGSQVCEATGRFEKATNNIVIKVGNLGAISRIALAAIVFPNFRRLNEHDQC